MTKQQEQRLRVVTGLDEDRRAVLEESSIDELLVTLCRRANRLIGDQETCEKTKTRLPGIHTQHSRVLRRFRRDGRVRHDEHHDSPGDCRHPW
jgi:hypothetical protein